MFQLSQAIDNSTEKFLLILNRLREPNLKSHVWQFIQDYQGLQAMILG